MMHNEVFNWFGALSLGLDGIEKEDKKMHHRLCDTDDIWPKLGLCYKERNMQIIVSPYCRWSLYNLCYLDRIKQSPKQAEIQFDLLPRNKGGDGIQRLRTFAHMSTPKMGRGAPSRFDGNDPAPQALHFQWLHQLAYTYSGLIVLK